MSLECLGDESTCEVVPERWVSEKPREPVHLNEKGCKVGKQACLPGR